MLSEIRRVSKKNSRKQKFHLYHKFVLFGPLVCWVVNIVHCLLVFEIKMSNMK